MPVVKFLILLYTLYTAYTASREPYQPAEWWSKVEAIHNDTLSNADKINKIQGYIALFNEKHIPEDSVYAFMLHRIGLYKSFDGQYAAAINWTNRALEVNRSNAASCCKPYTAKHLFNIGQYYKNTGNPAIAYRYYDSAVQVVEQYYPLNAQRLYEGYQIMCELKEDAGDFEGVVQVASRALQHNDSNFASYPPAFQSFIANAAVRLGRYDVARQFCDKAQHYYELHNDTVGLTNCWQTAAHLAFLQNQPDAAFQKLHTAILLCGNNYNDQKVSALLYEANFYKSDALQQFAKAKTAYTEAIRISAADADNSRHVAAWNNLGQVWASEKNWLQALHCYQMGFARLTGMDTAASPGSNPPFTALKTLPQKPLLFTTLRNKAEVLMLLYRQNSQREYINAATGCFLLADSLLTDMRNYQTGDESKLYWQEKTRNFFQQALELCSLTNNPELAYRFMEKSRAVLLNDHLSEMGAGRYLPAAAQAAEQALKMAVLENQVRLNDLPQESEGLVAAQRDLLIAQEKLEKFLHRLETDYPQYYQYKYADSIMPVEKLQQYLALNHQQWVQYFSSDSLLFVLYADGKQLQLHRRLVKNLHAVIDSFTRQSANAEWQNQHSADYYQYAYHLYDTLLGKIPLQPGRMIVSADNALFPFDALCSNLRQRSLLVDDYALSYAYSARFLLQFTDQPAVAHFSLLGMAPVHFADARLQPLSQSAEALNQLGAYYGQSSLQIEKNATRQCLLNGFSQYAVINLYTHASSDGAAGTGPELYLSDSTIRLSELQRIVQPVTRMVVLSACETAAGKVANGEGVISMARGFALAGIPNTVSTLWEVDENATYAIIGQFHKNLSQGMPKDVALQQAKKIWRQQGRQQRLPFNWAGITLTGDAAAIRFQPLVPLAVWWIGGALLIALSGVAYSFRKRRK